MKDEQFYIDKLLSLPDQFETYYYAKKWGSAKYVYDTAVRVTEFLNPPEWVKHKLFGYGTEDMDDEDVIQGMFDRKMVSRCHEECVVKSYKSYELESYRRFGQPPQYYPAPRYPVPGYPKET